MLRVYCTIAGRFGGAGGERLDEVSFERVEATFGSNRLGGGDRVKPAAETRGPVSGRNR